jgi:hypothetical protein
MRSRLIALALGAAFCLSAQAAAQYADKNTAGPTANQLQLKLVEPAEGATISGNRIRVSVQYARQSFGQGQGTRFGEPNFPHPIFDVFVDNQLKQSLKGGEANVAYIEDVPPGEHRIAVVAKNISGEVIDRKEVRVVNVEAATSASGDTAPAPPQPPAPAPESAQAQPAPSEEPVTAPRETLPATASPYPAVLLAGTALLAAGLVLSRKA